MRTRPLVFFVRESRLTETDRRATMIYGRRSGLINDKQYLNLVKQMCHLKKDCII